MKFSYTFALPVGADQAWERLKDPAALIPCIPGVESAQPEGEGGDRYRFTVAAAVGPVRVRFEGHAQVSIDAAARCIQADIAMNDARSGNVHGRFLMQLQPGPPGDGSTSQLVLDSEVAIAGRLGELGQGLIKRKADQMVKEFVGRVQGLLA